jgi:hypothetical protein
MGRQGTDVRSSAAKAGGIKKPRVIGGVAVESIDILQMELDGNLPYWLSPVVTYGNSPQARAARKKLYQQKWRERKRAKK